MAANRIIIVGGAKRGKSTLGRKLSEDFKLTHLQTDPQRLLRSDENGTPDNLAYGGEGGTGDWVAAHWIGRDRTLIEGVKAIDALKRHLSEDRDRRSSDVCDRLIVLTERVSGDESDAAYAGQERQAAHTMAVLEDLESQLDNLELWVPIGGDFVQADY
jgi:hypothetical protein